MVERYEKYINDGEYFRAQQRLDEATTTTDEDNDIETILMKQLNIPMKRMKLIY